MGDQPPRERRHQLPRHEQREQVARSDEDEHGSDEGEEECEQSGHADVVAHARRGEGDDGHGHGGDEDDHHPGEALHRDPELECLAPTPGGGRLGHGRPGSGGEGGDGAGDRQGEQRTPVVVGERHHDGGDERDDEEEPGHDQPRSRLSFSVMSALRIR